jgi:DNA-binding transcriptional LysR family regulator
MDLTQLRYFMTVVECANFTLAAKKCNVSQPALSQQIAKLEKEFGCSLFDRQGRQVTLTRVGYTLRDRAAQILQAVDDTRRQMLDDGRYGTINFAVVPVLGQYLSARILQSLSREFAESDLVFSELSATEIVRRIDNGEIDLGLLPYPVCCGRELDVEPIFEEEIKVAINRDHPLAKLSEVALEDLHGEKIVLLNDSHSFSQIISDVLETRNVLPRKTALVDNFAMMHYLVSLNTGIGFIPSSSAPRSVSGNVVFRSAVGLPLKRRLALCWNRKRYQTQLITNFKKAIRQFSVTELNPIENLEEQTSASSGELAFTGPQVGPR